ncbi:MAG: sigma-70 family RNA polymerase sigma factor [Candidatus Paceibacterota bacterium]|jgi:RNA polymerase sigma-70 factor (ECF subfamily)
MNDLDLIRAYKDGDSAAFERLVDAYVDRIFSFVRRLSGDDTVAEDATQETFIKVWKGIVRFDENRSFRAWIFAIARNAAVDILRRRRDVPFASIDARGDDDSSFAESIVDDSPLPDIVAEDSELRRAIDAVLGKVDAVDRSIVLLHGSEGLTFEEIALILDRPMNTIKSRYRRALLKLRVELGGSRQAMMHQKVDL